MPCADRADARPILREGIAQTINLSARKREHRVDVVRQKALDDSLRAGQLSCLHSAIGTRIARAALDGPRQTQAATRIWPRPARLAS